MPPSPGAGFQSEDQPIRTNSHLFVLTGGPGSGKTSLIEAARADGLRTTDEVGRAIIREQVAIGGNALPWADRVAFADRMLACEIETFDAAVATVEPTLCDRGVPDVLGYASLESLPDLSRYKAAAAAHGYASRVFIAPPWAEIYAQDGERKQDWALAVRTCAMMVSVYGGLGYHLIELPRADIVSRLAFVKAHMHD